MMSEAERHLRWDACLNVRDVGGYPTRDGKRIRWRALLRADNLCQLTPQGQQDLAAYGVRTVIDLRTPSELAMAPHPYAGYTASDVPLLYCHRPLIDENDAESLAAIAAAGTVPAEYVVIVDRFRDRIASIVQAVARAPEGGVLVHCHAGKDRTGITVAILLALAGVPHEIIAEDYAMSDAYLQPLYAEIMANAPDDPDERAALQSRLVSRPETILTMLSHLDSRYGGVDPYLQGAGVSEVDRERVRARLRE